MAASNKAPIKALYVSTSRYLPNHMGVAQGISMQIATCCPSGLFGFLP